MSAPVAPSRSAAEAGSLASVRRFVDPSAAAWLAATPAPRPAMLLDRDGVITANHGYVHTAAQTNWVEGIFELVAAAHRAGFAPIVATNQAGIARGLYSEAQFLDYTRWMHAEFAARGTPLLATFWCPHHPSVGIGEGLADCASRKPGAAMLLAAAQAFSLDLSRSLLVGDKPSDIEAGRRAGVGRSLLLGDDLASPRDAVGALA